MAFWGVLFEIGSPYVAQVDPELAAIILPQGGKTLVSHELEYASKIPSGTHAREELTVP